MRAIKPALMHWIPSELRS